MRRKETLAQMSPFARQAIRQDDDGPIPVRITFYPPDARRRDDDNMIGSFRAARDGIADALGVDDRRFRPHYFLPNRKSRAVWKSCLGCCVNVPVITAREPEATDAFNVHRALVLAEKRDPNLQRNPQWQCLRMDAYEAFCRAFEVTQ